MPSLQIPRDAEVFAPDGVVGRVQHVVVDPVTGDVTDLVVGADDERGAGWLVPIGAVNGVAGNRVAVRGERDTWRAAPRFNPADYEDVEQANGSAASLHRRATPGALTVHEQRRLADGASPDQTALAPTALGPRRLVLRAERLLLNKRVAPVEEVVVRKRVVTEFRTIEVPVRREELVVERIPAGATAADPNAPTVDVSELGTGDVQRLVLREEVVEVTIRTRATEEVLVGKRRVSDVARAAATVRREDIHVETTGELDVRDGGALSREPIRPEVVGP